MAVAFCIYNLSVIYEWDEDKNARNTTKHGVSFEAVYGLDWNTALAWKDSRSDYGEPRQVALGLIGERLFYCVFVDRGQHRRIISLRKANIRENKQYLGE